MTALLAPSRTMPRSMHPKCGMWAHMWLGRTKDNHKSYDTIHTIFCFCTADGCCCGWLPLAVREVPSSSVRLCEACIEGEFHPSQSPRPGLEPLAAQPSVSQSGNRLGPSCLVGFPRCCCNLGSSSTIIYLHAFTKKTVSWSVVLQCHESWLSLLLAPRRPLPCRPSIYVVSAVYCWQRYIDVPSLCALSSTYIFLQSEGLFSMFPSNQVYYIIGGDWGGFNLLPAPFNTLGLRNNGTRLESGVVCHISWHVRMIL